MSSSSKQIIAIFDLDRTITRRGTYTPALLGWALRHAPWRLLMAPVVALLMLGYVLKLQDRETLKVWMLRLLLGRVRKAALARWAEAFARQQVPKHCHQAVLAEIRALQAAGAQLAIATASFDWCARAIGAALGISAIIATRSVWTKDDRLAFAIDGRNCYGAEKRRMIEQAFVSSFGIERQDAKVLFYSDHHSDLPSFDFADEAIAACPTVKLRAIARQRGWRVL